jgi:flagellar protein FlbD
MADKDKRGTLSMIRLTRLNHVPIYVNSDLIEHIEVTPDTVIALTSGQRFMVLESAEEVVGRVVEFRRSILAGASPPWTGQDSGSGRAVEIKGDSEERNRPETEDLPGLPLESDRI